MTKNDKNLTPIYLYSILVLDVSAKLEEKNKRMSSELRRILTELKRITKGNLEIIDIYDNEIIIRAELSDNQFEKLKDWLRSNKYDVLGAVNQVIHYVAHDEDYVTEIYRKIDNNGDYTDNLLVIDYYHVISNDKSHDKEYYILKKIYFEGGK